MIKTRLALQEKLEEIMGGKYVYFQPPASVSLKYPCIVYSLSNIKSSNADNIKYLKDYKYTITLIHNDPDNCLVDEILKLHYITLENSFATQGLYHYVYTLYFKKEKENR